MHSYRLSTIYSSSISSLNVLAYYVLTKTDLVDYPILRIISLEDELIRGPHPARTLVSETIWITRGRD